MVNSTNSMGNLFSNLMRVRLDLEEYNFDIEYIKGRENDVAYALSRITNETIKACNITMVTTSARKNERTSPT